MKPAEMTVIVGVGVSMGDLKLFESTAIRSVWVETERKWYFSVHDIVGVLTDSIDPRQYVKKMRARDQVLSVNWGTICTQVEMTALDGKRRKTLAANAEGILRLIQSIPSPKAEPFKRWLAQVGAERLEEIENPELAAQRMRAIYRAKGYDEAWIEKRVRGIAIRDELTDEWKARGVGASREYAILTAEISKATFGVTPTEYKATKKLEDPDQLRDHMTDLELIFTMLGEASTTEITRTKNAQGFPENKKAARDGGTVAAMPGGSWSKLLVKKLYPTVISSILPRQN